MSTPEQEEEAAAGLPSSKSLFQEAFALFGVVFVLVLALALIAPMVSWIGGNLYAMVALVFIGVPQAWINRKKLNMDRFGLGLKRVGQGLLWGGLATVLTVVPFAVGQHVWATQVENKRFEWDQANWWKWPATMEGTPKGWGESQGVWVWSRDRALTVGMRAQATQSFRVTLSAKTPFVPEMLNTQHVLFRPVGENVSPAKVWEAMPTAFGRQTLVSFKTQGVKPQELTLQVKATKEAKIPLFQGPGASQVKGDSLTFGRSLGWIWLWMITQLFFIALPEEYFYRGYLQTRLKDGFLGRRQEHKVEESVQRADVISGRWAILITSICFGVGHLLIPVGGVLLVQRFSVFFPSLVFGWLRERTGGIIAPTIYHACCNMMVLLLSVHYS